LPDTDLLQAFGQALKYHRKAAELSQEALAEACGLHRTYIGGIERGERNVGLLNVYAICSALNIDPEVIFRTTNLFLCDQGVRPNNVLPQYNSDKS